MLQLILDADIYLGRHLRPIDLLASGPCTHEPVCDAFHNTSYKGIIAGVEMRYGDDYHRRWFTNSAAITLHLNVNFSQWNISLGVTPQVSSPCPHSTCMGPSTRNLTAFIVACLLEPCSHCVYE